MCPTPVIVVGPSATAASAATTGVSSLASWRSSGAPASGAAEALSPSGAAVTAAPMRIRTSRIAAPGWVLRRGQPAIVTVPPVSTPAARKAAAFVRSGSMRSSRASTTPGRTRQ